MGPVTRTCRSAPDSLFGTWAHGSYNRALEEKLQAARSSNRFLGKRIADLEAELATPRSQQEAT